jgi:hypothetical protein
VRDDPGTHLHEHITFLTSPCPYQSGAVSLERVDLTVKIHAVSRQREMSDKKREQTVQGEHSSSNVDDHHRHLCDLLGEVSWGAKDDMDKSLPRYIVRLTRLVVDPQVRSLCQRSHCAIPDAGQGSRERKRRFSHPRVQFKVIAYCSSGSEHRKVLKILNKTCSEAMDGMRPFIKQYGEVTSQAERDVGLAMEMLFPAKRVGSNA